MGRLEDTLALVVGGGRGIGKAIALAFAREGADVCVAGRTLDKVQSTVREIKAMDRKATAMQVDIGRLSDIERMIADVEHLYGRINILVNSAGVFLNPLVEETTEEDWDTIMNVQLKGVFFTIQGVVRVMLREGGGSIINLASVLGVRGKEGCCVYCAAKGGIINMTRALAVELGSRNIRVNAIAPGFTLDPSDDRVAPELVQRLAERIPVGKPGAPEEITGIAIYLASDDARFTTGTTFFVDGGESAV
jgi:3-oxoacyl-[acyl-carrier protein] reductase